MRHISVYRVDEDEYKKEILTWAQNDRATACLSCMNILTNMDLERDERRDLKKRMATIFEADPEILDIAIANELINESGLKGGLGVYFLQDLGGFIDPQDTKRKRDWTMEIIESDIDSSQKEWLVEAFFHGKGYANQSIQDVFIASSTRMDQLVYGQDVTKLSQEVKTQLEKTLKKHHNYYHSKTTFLGDD